MLPAGRGHLSTTAFTMKDGDVASVLYYPDTISQRVEDTIIVSSVDGRVGDQEAITNVGVVMPRDVRGEDTATGETDRISEGDGNWGSFTGVAQVFPALLGLQQVDFDVARPADDDKYGNAVVSAADIGRANLIGRSVFHVTGTVQTAPSVDANGNPDGQAQNADQLRLQALVLINTMFVPYLTTPGFSVVAKPVAVKTAASKFYRGDVVAKEDGQYYLFAIKFSDTFVSDGGALDNVLISEDVVIKTRKGMFEK